MLRSMTGFGAGRGEDAGTRATVEIRAVNHRHLKLTVRGTDPYPLQDAEFEKVARASVKRGSLLVFVSVDRPAGPGDYRLNAAALRAYIDQIEAAAPAHVVPGLLAGVLALPGVAPASGSGGPPPDDEWPAVESAFRGALEQLARARDNEGAAMAAELLTLHADMVLKLAAVREHLPAVMAAYRTRLLERLRQAVGAAGVTLDETHLVRELALYADRTDVSEEVHRLTAHLEQFAALVSGREKSPDGAGRRLEFLVQEMGREVNTLGSKAGDVTLSRVVFDLKAGLEKVRELIANVE